MAAASAAASATRAPSAPEQIHVAYTQRQGQLSVDFVGGAASGFVSWGASPTSLTHSANSTSFEFATIGFLHQAVMDFTFLPTGAPAYYKVSVGGVSSATFEASPLSLARPEVFVVFGDFGLENDVSMSSLVSDAAAGAFDSVLHVGE